jgi:hypothetical protein
MKILACHQPNFLPWLGYFEKYLVADVFISMDNVQYERRGYTNRCKILNNMGKEVWLTLKTEKEKHGETKIKDIKLNKLPYKEILDIIYGSYSKTNRAVEELLFLLQDNEFPLLMPTNKMLIYYLLEFMERRTDVLISDLKFNDVFQKTERIISYCKLYDCDTYFSGAGAKIYLDEKLMLDNNIKVVWQEFKPFEYKQMYTDKFVNGLSSLDCLLNGVDLIPFVNRCNQLQERIKNGDQV